MKLLVFGDSNSNRPEGGENTWPGLLKDIGGEGLEVINDSLDGRTVLTDIGDLNGLNDFLAHMTLHLPLDYVLFMLGTNDVKLQYGPPKEEDISRGLKKMVGMVAENGAGAIPLLLTPPPMGKIRGGDFHYAEKRIKRLARRYRKLSKELGIGLIDVHKELACHQDLQADMIHLNNSGRRKVAEMVWRFVF